MQEDGGPEGIRRVGAIVLIGASGSGKSTIGKRLATALEVTFIEGDEYHSSGAIAKMRAGVALNDEDRWPWLDKVGRATADHIAQGRAVVVACSALKRAYRDALTAAARCPLIFVHLTVDAARLETRMNARGRHFMPSMLLKSQLEALEPLQADEIGMDIAETGTEEQTVLTIERRLRDRLEDSALIFSH